MIVWFNCFEGTCCWLLQLLSPLSHNSTISAWGDAFGWAVMIFHKMKRWILLDLLRALSLCFTGRMLWFRSITPVLWTFFFKFACVHCLFRRIAVSIPVPRIYNLVAVMAGYSFRQKASDTDWQMVFPTLPKNTELPENHLSIHCFPNYPKTVCQARGILGARAPGWLVVPRLLPCGVAVNCA